MTGTSTARDAIESLELAIIEAERLTARALLDDCTDETTGALSPCVIVTDNGPAFKPANEPWISNGATGAAVALDFLDWR